MKTTLIILLLPFTALCQSPPCLVTEANANTFEFGFAYPAECQYIASWMDDFIDCHGAMNRRPGFFRLTVASDTTYTVQVGTDGNPLDLVFTFWDACPFQGGNTVASIACGGWDCIEWGAVGFEAVITLPAGQYWFWAGMFSDGVTCTEGIVQGGMTIGGECDTPPPPNYLPCPAVTVVSNGQTVTYCDDQESEPFDTGLPCNPQENYMTVEFTTDGSPYPIHVWSDYNYVAFPNTPTNYPDFAIYTGCGGDLVYTTFGGACAFGSGIAPPAPSGIEYTMNLDLPAGTYVAVIGFWAAVGTSFESEGCVEVTFGGIQFLNLPNEDSSPNVDSSNVDSSPLFPRYTKVVIEGRGVFIRDGKDGRIYDIVTRKIVE